jgi:hypothetical protein
VNEPIAPYVSVSINRDGKDPIERRIRIAADDFTASRDDCDVHVGRSYLRRHGNYSSTHGGRYQLHIEDDDLLVDMQLSSHMPPWRPETGHFMFGDSDYFGWVAPVVGGNTSGEARVNGERLRLDGNGYHDHNFGNQNPAKLMRRWQWYHGTVGNWARDRHPNIPPMRPMINLSVLGAQLTAREAYGGNTIPVFMAAEDGSVFLQGGRQLDAYLETGTPTAHSAYFSYNDERNRLGVHFDAEREISRRLRPVGTVAVRAYDAAPPYRRFDGTMTVDHSIHDTREATYQNLHVARGIGKCMLEDMYFGEAY